jgi:hypothetical protein
MPDISISPDGKTIALVAKLTRAPHPRYAPGNDVKFTRVAGTDDAALPFWSPDSRSVAFVAGDRLKRVIAAGGPPKDIGPAEGFNGGTWSKDNVILFGSAAGLRRVSAEGGTQDALTTAEKLETGHFWPHFLPDGTHYLYLSWSDDPKSRAVMVGSIGTTDKTKTASAETIGARSPGHLLFHREATVFAQRFDAGRNHQRRAGASRPATSFNPANGRASFDVSQDGSLIFNQAAVAPSVVRSHAECVFGIRDEPGRSGAGW